MKMLGFTPEEFQAVRVGEKFFTMAECSDGTLTAVPVRIEEFFTIDDVTKSFARVFPLNHEPVFDAEEFRGHVRPYELFRTADEAFAAIEMRFRIEIEQAKRQIVHAKENRCLFKQLEGDLNFGLKLK
jgi:hypothetical protein